jgi:hypothetical protein
MILKGTIKFSDDADVERLEKAIRSALSSMPAHELAGYFIRGDENQRVIYRNFVRSQPQEYQKEFNKQVSEQSSLYNPSSL